MCADHRHGLLCGRVCAAAAIFLGGELGERDFDGVGVERGDDGCGAVCVWVFQDLLCAGVEGEG